MRSWLRGSGGSSKDTSKSSTQKSNSADTTPRNSVYGTVSKAAESVESEASDIDDALAAADMIMNDDIDGAEARLRLRKDTSSFHMLGLGASTFMRSVMGVEKEIINEAAARLNDCESRAWSDMKKAQKEADKAAKGGGYRLFGLTGSSAAAPQTGSAEASKIYPAGSEFALVYAQAQLMNAVLAVTQESFSEGLKGFYKLRKAYISLNEIIESEIKYLSAQHEADTKTVPATQVLEKTISASTNATTGVNQLSRLPSISPDSAMFNSSVDIFVHSGANMSFGVLNLLLSMIPPALGRLLQVIGFRGDRARGIRMLWQSTKFPNLHGAMAAFALLAYYNDILGVADILPSVSDVDALADGGEVVGNPKERCMALLNDMRERYPDSRFWKFEEARILANRRRLVEAVDVLLTNNGSQMKQVEALNTFELALDTMFLRRWENMREHFLKCVELNDWSHAIYFFHIGCAELELYRDAFHRAAALEKLPEGVQEAKTFSTEARKHKKAAEEYFRKVPAVAGRKRFMARQMPFELLVCRKVQKWEERATTLGLDLADAIGSSPTYEMAYLWNGTKRMDVETLEGGLPYISWDRCTASPDKVAQIQEEKDEVAIEVLTRAACLRSLGKYSEAKEALKPVLSFDPAAFKGPTRDDYVLPSAHYEMAANIWMESNDPPLDATDKETYRRDKTAECQSYLQQVAKWEAFVLDGRLGMRVQAGLNTTAWLKKKKGWA